MEDFFILVINLAFGERQNSHGPLFTTMFFLGGRRGNFKRLMTIGAGVNVDSKIKSFAFWLNNRLIQQLHHNGRCNDPPFDLMLLVSLTWEQNPESFNISTFSDV